MRLMANYFDHLLSLDTPTYTVAQMAKRFEPSTVLWAFYTIQPSCLNWISLPQLLVLTVGPKSPKIQPFGVAEQVYTGLLLRLSLNQQLKEK